MTYHFTFTDETYLFIWCLLAGFCILFIGVVIWLVAVTVKARNTFLSNKQSWKELEKLIIDINKPVKELQKQVEGLSQHWIQQNAIQGLPKRLEKIESLIMDICPPERQAFVRFELTGILLTKTDEPKSEQVAEDKE